jgi:hypothetical protein
MRKLNLEIALAIALIVGALLSLATGARASDVMVSDAYARASAVATARAGAVYLRLMNHGAAPDRLLAIRTTVAAAASLHDTVTEGDVTVMREVESLDLAPGATQELAPNGLHVMLTGLKAPLREGDSFAMVLVFERAGEVPVTVTVGSVAAGTSHEGHAGTSGD